MEVGLGACSSQATAWHVAHGVLPALISRVLREVVADERHIDFLELHLVVAVIPRIRHEGNGALVTILGDHPRSTADLVLHRVAGCQPTHGRLALLPAGPRGIYVALQTRGGRAIDRDRYWLCMGP